MDLPNQEPGEFPKPLVEAAAQLIDGLRFKKAMLATAESCTGGLLSGLLTSVAGASDVFGFGFVTYSNLAKIDLLGVPAVLLERHGAVSSEVASAMAEGARARAGSHFALAVTGVAGPGGGSSEKPVGLVYIGLASASQPTAVEELRLGPASRSVIRLKTTQRAIAIAAAAVENLPTS